MADNTENETEFSEAQIRTIAQIVAATLVQDRAQNQNTPPSGSQPVAEERPIPEPVSERMLTQPLTDFSLVQSAGLNIEELYKEEKKKNRGFGNYRTSYGDRGAGSSNQNQLRTNNVVVGAVNERTRREFTDLGRPLSTVSTMVRSLFGN
ncbi:hypothetical protein JCGZ_06375 [Jatropha curcas]|uniref:Uncharacterized protein n=1 Tax=Jatropha curcas TaxID=180498 RepID=A0A067KP64_JATCU|nr:hypothetical protein JCGZ_06375 [Jatropha curcas]